MSRIRPAGHNLNSVGWAVKPQTNFEYTSCGLEPYGKNLKLMILDFYKEYPCYGFTS